MGEVLKATPRPIVRGIRDSSRRRLTPSPELLPQHLPFIPHFMRKGRETPQVAIGDDFNQMYGSESLNLIGKYATHQTPLALYVAGRGNTIMWKRLRTPGARTALLRISLEVIPAEVPLWKRNTDGSYMLDANGDRIQMLDGLDQPAFVIGHRLVWHVGTSIYPAAMRGFGQAEVLSEYRQGSYNSTVAGDLSTLLDNTENVVTSTLYPWMELEVDSFGNWGNDVGIKIDAPNSDSLSPGDSSLMNTLGAYLYRFTTYERDESTSTALIQETIQGETSLDLTLKDNVVDGTGKQRTITDALIQAYQYLNDPTITPVYGSFGRINVYKDNVDTILAILADGGVTVNTGTTTIGEGDYDSSYLPKPNLVGQYFPRGDSYRFNTEAGDPIPNRRHLLNVFTGVDQYGVPYYTFDVENSVNFAGTSFGDRIHYATGGDDGLFMDSNGKPDQKANLKLYDQLVAQEMANFGSLSATGWAGLDVAKYPFSTIWDTGFSLSTKKKLLVPMSRRKDVNVWLATLSVGDYTDPSVPDKLASVWIDSNVALTGLVSAVSAYGLNDGDTVYLRGQTTLAQNGTYTYAISGANYTLTAVDNTWGLKGQQTADEEVQTALNLMSVIQGMPEAPIYGTPACRAVIVAQSGYLLNSLYKGLLPLTVDVADKVANYMGASNGRWTNQQQFDEDPGNVVTLFRDVNDIWRDDGAYNTAWENNIVWAQSYDRRQYFYPAFQTVYPYDDSVLNSAVLMMACCEIEKVVQLVWRRLTGNTRLTKEQFIERSNQLIADNTDGRFDGRFPIVPETGFTDGDNERGYSWYCTVKIGSGVMQTVGVMTIEAMRREDLLAQTQ